jgi:hypothetical protein
LLPPAPPATSVRRSLAHFIPLFCDSTLVIRRPAPARICGRLPPHPELFDFLPACSNSTCAILLR